MIKIEAPEGGDNSRHFAPRQGGESCYFMLVNRNKRSVALDLKQDADLRKAHELANLSDVVVENFKPGVAKRLRIDYATLIAFNPRLVYASISGFGQDGPLSQQPAYDIIAQAMGGIMSVNGALGGPPTRVGKSIGDLAAGLYASWAILAALRARDRDGHGQHLDIAMLDSISHSWSPPCPNIFSRGLCRGGSAMPIRLVPRLTVSAPRTASSSSPSQTMRCSAAFARRSASQALSTIRASPQTVSENAMRPRSGSLSRAGP